MKLVVAVVQDRDVNGLLDALSHTGYRATKLASTGGFLRGGNTTMLMGVEDHQVEEAIGIIRRTCQAREQFVTPVSPAAATGEAFIPFPTEVLVGGGIIFVLEIAQFEKV
jgi:uncharacterized protein YaaQ